MSAGFTLLAHADWSVSAKKRWLACAELQPSGEWLALPPRSVSEPELLFTSLRSPSGCALVGFDFPIGLPLHYARLAGIDSFLTWLPGLGKPPWQDFACPAALPGEISIHHPFYPCKAGRSRQSHLLEALRAAQMDDLRRVCELRTASRRAACPLFWTLGGQQVGKAALNGWTEVLQPALHQSGYPFAIWPFSGPLEGLAESGGVVAAETYPAEFYHHFELRFGPGKSKRRQVDRQDQAGKLLTWAQQSNLRLHPELEQAIHNGFGNRPDGEDRFDAVVGLLGMLNLVLCTQRLWEPDSPHLRRIEGWILGQANPQSQPPDLSNGFSTR